MFLFLFLVGRFLRAIVESCLMEHVFLLREALHISNITRPWKPVSFPYWIVLKLVICCLDMTESMLFSYS